MASTPESRRTTTSNSGSKNRCGASVSHFQKTVCLLDWWLIRAQNDSNRKTLAVAGLASTPDQPVRVFSSAPIVKRYDVFTLETADGICVVLKGFINKLRTTDNGFTAEVFKHFVFGFPPNWEACAANCFEEEAFDSPVAAGNISDTDGFLCRSKVNKQNRYIVEDGSLLESVAKQGLDHGDTMAQRTSATETAVCFNDSIGSPNKTGADIEDDEVERKRKVEEESLKKAKRKIIFDSPGNGVSTNTRQKKERNCIVSPECMSYGRSRSGRLLLPTMEFWRNQIPVYDSDRKIRGIQEGLPDIQPHSRPRDKKSNKKKEKSWLQAAKAKVAVEGSRVSKRLKWPTGN